MALDVYVGSLTRYYLENWETPLQRYARETGKQLLRIRTNGQGDNSTDVETDPETVRTAVIGWKDMLNTGLSEVLSSPLEWDETGTSIYFSEQLRWDNLSSLKLWAAYLENPDLSRPIQGVEDWNSDEAFKRIAEPNDSKYASITRDVAVWLPADCDRLVFTTQEINGITTNFSTLLALRKELSEMNELTWKADRTTIQRWKRESPTPNSALEDGAKFGFALLYTLADIALEHKLVMRLDG